MLKRTYELDMVPGGIPLSIHLSQYDSDVLLVFRLYATLKVYFEATINGNVVRSNELFYEIIWLETLNTTPVIASSFNATDVVQYATVTIPYLVYSPSSQMSDVIIKVGERMVSEITVDRSKQVFSYRVNNAGEVVMEDNWIADTQDGGLLLERYNRNNIRDAYKSEFVEVSIC